MRHVTEAVANTVMSTSALRFARIIVAKQVKVCIINYTTNARYVLQQRAVGVRIFERHNGLINTCTPNTPVA
jgi:hypothetical protein